ncbi:MAG: energy-coupling factor transporter transmembrane component T [Sulfolobales archaeon]
MRPLTLFIYGLTVTVLAFIARSTQQLVLLSLINAPIGILLGFRRFKALIILFLIGLIGLFINALMFANNGAAVLNLYIITVREGALISFLNVTLRLLIILNATLIFITRINVRDFIKSLEEELGLPKDIAYALAVGLRMLSILERDAKEIQLIRVERGYRRFPLTPTDVSSFLRPLLSLGLERAVWIGIATELRGFAIRSSKRSGFKVGISDMLIYSFLVLQCVLVLMLF